jgi:DNA-binding YbaB/EbfC family protein
MTTGMPDFGELLAQAQQSIANAQAGLEHQESTGTAGGGLVTATVNGLGDLLSLSIDPAALDPDDADALETLADLVVAAVRDARSAAESQAGAMMAGGLESLTGSLGAVLGVDPGPAPVDDAEPEDESGS